MLKRIKCIFSILLVTIFLLQSISMPAMYASNAKDAVMEISVPQLSLMNFGNSSNMNIMPTNLTSSAITLDGDRAKELENIDGIKLFKKDISDFETDRFIIKYRSENSKIKARKAFEKVDKIDMKLNKHLKNYSINKKSKNNKEKNENIDIIYMNKKEKLKDFASDLENSDLKNDIEYIQPDYQLSLSSNDT